MFNKPALGWRKRQIIVSIEAEPVAWQYTTNFYNPNKDNGKRLSYSLGFAQVHAIPDTIEPLYTHPQPKREPLTDEQVDDLHGEANRGFCIEREDYFKAFRDAETAHGITSDTKQEHVDKTAKQRHEWVGLTDEDWGYIEKNCGSIRSAIKTAEALLKEKNQ